MEVIFIRKLYILLPKFTLKRVSSALIASMLIAQIGISSGYENIFADEPSVKIDSRKVEKNESSQQGDLPEGSDYDTEEVGSKKVDPEKVEKNTTTSETDKNEIDSESLKFNTGLTPAITPRALEPGEVDVSDWEQFRTAYNNDSTTKINLKADIKTTQSTTGTTGNYYLRPRKKSIEINGSRVDGTYYRLQLYGTAGHAYLPVDSVNTSENAVFNIHDVLISQTVHPYIVEDSAYAFIGSSGWTDGANWKFRIGNLDTDDAENGSSAAVSRVVIAKRSEITFYGKVHVKPRAEAAIVGSVKFEPNTEFTSKVQNEDVSCFWFWSEGAAGTGSSHEFTVGDGATVKLDPADGKGLYPPIYYDFATITVGKNAMLTCLAEGNALRFQRDSYNQKLKVEEGGILFLKSYGQSNYTYGSYVINMLAGNYTMDAEAGSRIYLYSTSKDAVIRMGPDSATTYTNKITINNPAAFDIVSTQKGNVFNNMSNVDEFNVNGVSLFAWNKSDNIQNNPSQCFDYANWVKVKSNTNVTSDNANVVSYLNPNNRSRIAGGDFDPVIVYGRVPDSCNHDNKLTDADKTIRARVRLGQFPMVDEEASVGNTTDTQDVWSPANFFTNGAKIENPLDNLGASLNTDSDGYLKYTAGNFYPAGTHFKTTIDRGYINGKADVVAETDVIDITPPDPAVVVTTPIKHSTRLIEGEGGEVGATVKVKYDGSFMQKDGQDVQATVGEDGKWSLNLPNVELEVSKYVTIYMSDANGNTNPDVDTVRHDTTFTKATSIKVSGVLEFTNIPDKISFGTTQLVKGSPIAKWGSYTGTLGVIDTREVKKEWQLSAKMSKELTDNSNSTRVMPGVICYYTGGVRHILSSSSNTIIKQNTNTNSSEYVVSNQWNNSNTGIKLEVPADMIRAGQYSGEIEWSLQDTP